MEPNETKNTEMKFPADLYDRAKEAKEEAAKFAAELNAAHVFPDPDQLSSLEELIEKQDVDVRLVIGLGRFNWSKGIIDFDMPSTRAVMQRMKNLSSADQRRLVHDYLEIHLRYDVTSTEDRYGFRHHTTMHNIYRGSYVPWTEDDEDENDAE